MDYIPSEFVLGEVLMPPLLVAAVLGVATAAATGAALNRFRLSRFFRETSLEEVRPGNRAVVTLMSYSDRPLTGRVDSIGWGIAQDDGSTGFNLLPNVAPTFEWIRLAQRVPVRVELDALPEGVELRVGTTASVLVMTGSGSDQDATPDPVAAPAVLQ